MNEASLTNNNFINVLVVDDKQENLHAMQRLLQELPINIHTAESGEKALQLVIRHHYALLIVDVQMPGMDGFELATILSQTPQTAVIPIIFVTAAHYNLDAYRQGYEVGAYDYLAKPFDPLVLTSKVNVFIKLYRQQLNHQNLLTQQRTLLNTLNDGWWQWEIGSQQFMVSDSFKRLLGYTPQDLNNSLKVWQQQLLFDQQEGERHQQAIEAHLHQRKPYKLVLCFQHQKAYKVWILAHGVKLTDLTGKMTIVGTYTNVSDIKKTEKLLRSSNHDLEKYTYVTAHDLRSPLRGVTSLLNWIEEDTTSQLSDTSLVYVAKMKQRIRRMENLISGILAYSRLELREKERESVDVQALIEREIKTFTDTSNAKIICDNPLPKLSADHFQLQQVFNNLIDNAIKHTDKAEPVIHIGSRLDLPYVVFYVHDNGPGIAKQYQDKVFELFKTLQAGDNIQSTGVGLTIVKKIIDLHHGKIWIDNEVKYGSCFRFTWPLIQIDSAN